MPGKVIGPEPGELTGGSPDGKRILLSQEEMRGILDGTRTRVVKLITCQYVGTDIVQIEGLMMEMKRGIRLYQMPTGQCRLCDSFCILRKPPFSPGDRVQGQESFFRLDPWAPGNDTPDTILYYRASGDARPEMYRGRVWEKSIHMPRWASRLTLEIIKVTPMRIQKTSREQMKAEGVPKRWHPVDRVFCPVCHGTGRTKSGAPCTRCRTMAQRYQNRWEVSLGRLSRVKYGWDQNPWVWGIDFRVAALNPAAAVRVPGVSR